MRLHGWMIWICGNLFLAWLPVALAAGIAQGLGRDLARSRIRWGLWLPLLLIWLLFLPNTCYLLTEWRHFLSAIHRNPVYPTIYEQGLYPAGPTLALLLLTVFYVFYTGAGLLAFCLAVRPLHRLAQRLWGPVAFVALPVVFLLCALGVSLGLVNRFNSWDFVHPSRALLILAAAGHTLAHPLWLALIVSFASFLWLLYHVFNLGMDGLAARRRSLSSETLPHASA